MTIEERAREYIERSNIDEASGIITALLEEVERAKRELSVLKDVEVCKECISDTTRAAMERCANLAETIETDHWSKVGDPRLKQPHCAIATAIRKEMEKL